MLPSDRITIIKRYLDGLEQDIRDLHKPGTYNLDAVIKETVHSALQEAKGNKRKACRLLGIGERTLYNWKRNHRYGL